MPTLAARNRESQRRLLTDPQFAAEAAFVRWKMLEPYGGPSAHVAYLAFAAACAGLKQEQDSGRPPS